MPASSECPLLGDKDSRLLDLCDQAFGINSGILTSFRDFEDDTGRVLGNKLLAISNLESALTAFDEAYGRTRCCCFNNRDRQICRAALDLLRWSRSYGEEVARLSQEKITGDNGLNGVRSVPQAILIATQGENKRKMDSAGSRLLGHVASMKEDKNWVAGEEQRTAAAAAVKESTSTPGGGGRLLLGRRVTVAAEHQLLCHVGLKPSLHFPSLAWWCYNSASFDQR